MSVSHIIITSGIISFILGLILGAWLGAAYVIGTAEAAAIDDKDAPCDHPLFAAPGSIIKNGEFNG